MRRTQATGFHSVALLAVLIAIGAGSALGGEHDAHGSHAAHTDLLEPGDASPDSIYQLESLWTTAEGEQVPLASLAGRVQVIAMVYTHCEHACPRIIADMKQLRREIGDADGRVGYVLVSLDPARDTVERLAEFAKQTKLDAGWTLLRAGDGAVRELAAVLGIRYRQVSEKDFIHSNLLSIVDADGVIVHRQVGLGVDPEASAAAIREVLARGD